MKNIKMTKKDIKTILECAEKTERIATKYGIVGNFGQVYIVALKQMKEERRGRNEKEK